MDEEKKEKMNDVNMIKSIPLYKKFWYSITKFEKYPDMASEGVGKAFGYLVILILIFSILVCAGILIKYHSFNNFIIESLENNKGNLNSEFTQIMNELETQDLSLIVVVSTFIAYFISALVNILILSLFGNLVALIAKIKMRYRALFNMSVYSITISTILQIIYIFINIFTDFKIKNFDLMYTTISFICLAAAIFMIKSDLIKQQIEIMKIIEHKKQENEEKQEEEKEKKEEVNKEEEKDKKEQEENKEKKEEEQNKEPEKEDKKEEKKKEKKEKKEKEKKQEKEKNNNQEKDRTTGDLDGAEGTLIEVNSQSIERGKE